jgi:hypothetical protein
MAGPILDHALILLEALWAFLAACFQAVSGTGHRRPVYPQSSKASEAGALT